MKRLKSPITVRGDSVYCPLPLSLDSYWNCLTDCHHCYLRNMNKVWGEELRPLDIEIFKKTLHNGLKNKNPRSVLAHCLSRKKTIRWGNKTDPFQKAERKHRLAPAIFKELYGLEWSFVIETMHTDVMMDYSYEIEECARRELVTAMPVISCGLEKDWEVLERKRTNNPLQRLHHLRQLQRIGVNCGVNGEPFIPGYHTEKDWEDTLKLLVSYGIKSYNVYNLHLNPFVAKRLHAIGLDIEKIWTLNKDEHWRPILRRLLSISEKYPVRIGCPDFVNSGWGWMEQANTCCGVNVPNPCTFNTHNFKQFAQQAEVEHGDILRETFDGSADYVVGADVLGSPLPQKFYTIHDARQVQ